MKKRYIVMFLICLFSIFLMIGPMIIIPIIILGLCFSFAKIIEHYYFKK